MEQDVDNTRPSDYRRSLTIPRDLLTQQILIDRITTNQRGSEATPRCLSSSDRSFEFGSDCGSWRNRALNVFKAALTGSSTDRILCSVDLSVNSIFP